VSEQLAHLPEYLSAHVRLTLAALAAGTLLAVPTGVLVRRVRALEAPVLALASVIQTVPALALLAVMVPLLSALGLPGIGTLPAFLALVLYSLLPILRNTVTGLQGLDPAVLEAARGLGMTRAQRLRDVELPLALPVIVAGLRIATVTVISVAVVAAYVNAGGLGTLIFAGISNDHAPKIWSGALTACALAIVADAALARLELAAKRRAE